jgi:hypothetical protein
MAKHAISRQALLAKIRKRVFDEGRLAEFDTVQKLCIERGISTKLAYRYAVQYFKPLDGSPIEVEEKIIELDITRLPSKADHIDPAVIARQAALLAAEPPMPRPTAPVVPEGKATGKAKWDRWWMELVARVPPEKKATAREIAQWVFDNAYQDLANIVPSSVPCVGAVGMLYNVRQSDVAYQDFLRTVWVKFLPTQAQVNKEQDFVDDNRTQYQHLDRIAEEFAAKAG